MAKKINFIGFWKGFDKADNFIVNVLKDKFELIIDENPDYIFFGPFSKPFEYVNYDCIRIYWTGEPITPDFQSFDYAIGFDDISFGDRYIRFPLFFLDSIYLSRKGLTLEEAKGVLAQKKYFCNFIYGHKTNDGIREQLFNALSGYKKVESFGTYLNNQENGCVVKMNEKSNVLKCSKFTIACESFAYPGFTSEKIAHPFSNCSVPIYYGDPDVDKYFNEKAFLNVRKFKDISQLVDRVIELDYNDEEYLKMLMESPLKDPDYIVNNRKKFNDFLVNILEQDYDKAFRRIRQYTAMEIEGHKKAYSKFFGSFSFKLLKKMKKID